MVPRLGVGGAMHAVTCLAFLHALCSLVPSLPFQLLSFCLFTIFRAAIFSLMAIFIAEIFGPGKLGLMCARPLLTLCS